jgi:hypothetical protein
MTCPSLRRKEGISQMEELEMRKRSIVAVITFMLLWTGKAFAAHPLITDDTGTQGKGKFQFEFIGEYGHDKENGVTTKNSTFPTIPVLSYGVTDTLDVVFGMPYTIVKTEEAGTETRLSGFGDASIELKARFYEKDGLSFAVKPGINLPTGDEEKGLGNGKVSYRTFFITTKEAAPWAFHLNVGYIRSEYKLSADKDANRKDIWHVSLASQVEVVKDLKVVSNIGMERNSDKTSETHPAFILGGLIYSIAENLDVDFGVKGALNRTETDITYLAGITARF